MAMSYAILMEHLGLCFDISVEQSRNGCGRVFRVRARNADNGQLLESSIFRSKQSALSHFEMRVAQDVRLSGSTQEAGA